MIDASPDTPAERLGILDPGERIPGQGAPQGACRRTPRYSAAVVIVVYFVVMWAVLRAGGTEPWLLHPPLLVLGGLAALWPIQETRRCRNRFFNLTGRRDYIGIVSWMSGHIFRDHPIHRRSGFDYRPGPRPAIRLVDDWRTGHRVVIGFDNLSPGGASVLCRLFAGQAEARA